MNPKITNLIYALISIALLVAGIMSYQWVQSCANDKKPLVIFPSPSVTLVDKVIHCQSETAHKMPSKIYATVGELDEIDRIAAASSLMAVHKKVSQQCQKKPEVDLLLSLPEFTQLISLERQVLAEHGNDNFNDRLLMLGKIADLACESPVKTKRHNA